MSKQAVRPSWKTSIQEALPYSVKALLQAYRLARGAELYVEIQGAPPSVNHSNRSFRNKYTGKMNFAAPTPEVKTFRNIVAAACWGKRWEPKGTAAAVMVVESPVWITQAHTVRAKDIDNTMKVTIDAMRDALRFEDENLWEVHAAKLFGRREAIHVWLFDLGDVVTAVGATRE